ncbi:MAG: toll/interleukin-1 receptor domain-containing protein, partial [Gemmataceae bacterium]|nr:toll/interleukin-1 receptor domain-containing protein [Gemmataceae bacterium]
DSVRSSSCRRVTTPRRRGLDVFNTAFLCHNGVDKEWVEKLAEQVESETFDGTPNGRRLRAWFDKWDIDKGENVIVRINDGLARAPHQRRAGPRPVRRRRRLPGDAGRPVADL